LIVAARRQARTAEELRTAATRVRIDREERERFLRGREAVADGGDIATAVVNAPTAVVRFSHDAIAAIPFTVLENIPATAETTKVVHAIHDEISHAVYDVISGTTKGIAGLIRRGLAVPPPRQQLAAPKPGPTPPADRPRPTPRPPELS
jgi:hypothetical protein